MSASTPTSSAAGAGAASANPEDVPLLYVKRRKLLLVGIILVSVAQFLDATIATVALPSMKAALGASSDSITWVLTSFIIATAIATPITGWLSDRIGSRNLFIGSTMLFLLASAACGAATTLPAMVTFRVIQGVASAFIGPMTMTIMFDISPPSKQAMTMSIFGMIVMVAPISGPFLGGLLTQYLNWRWIFYINLPVCIPALVIMWWLLPSRKLVQRKLDLFGFAAIAIGLGALQLMLDRGQGEDWFGSWEIVIEAMIAISAVWVFVIHSRTAKHPLFPRELFANTNFVISLGFMSVMGISVVGLSAVLPQMFQSIYGYPVMDTGLLMAPRGLGVMITSFTVGMLASRLDTRYVIVAGYLTAALGMWYMTTWAIEMGSTPILLAAFVQGLGFGMIVSPMNLLAFATLRPGMRPDGSSLMALFRSLGGSIGISMIVSIMARNQQVSHSDLAAHVTSTSIPAIDLPSVVDRLPGIGTGVMAAINGEVTRQAAMIAFLDNFYFLTWLLLAFAPLPLLLRKAARVPPPPIAVDK
jgi:DHA2 family multidrug resistance protein